MAKLQAGGVGTTYLNFLSSYPNPRDAKVAVEGVSSDVIKICNTVFQGTVLGPPLWNLFFNDVSVSASSLGDSASVFADDLNVFQRFDREIPNDDIERKMHLCRVRVHKWGNTNRVAFDPGKEHIVILHLAMDLVIPLSCWGFWSM